MRKFTHVRAIEDVVEEGVVLYKKGGVYKILGNDYRSLVYYVEPEYYEESPLPDEFVIPFMHGSFEFLKCK